MRLTNSGPGSQQAADSAARLLKRVLAGDSAVLDEATTQLRNVLAHTRADDPDRAGRLSNLGAALQLRFTRTGSQEDLAEAVAVARDAVAVTGPGDGDALMYRINLFSVLATRASGSNADADLDEAIAVGLDVRAQAPPLYPNLDRLLANLAETLRARFARAGHEGDLDEEIEVLRGAVTAATPAGTVMIQVLPGAVSAAQGGAEQAEYRSRLGKALQARFGLRARVQDLDEAIENMRIAQAGLPPGRDRAVLAVHLYDALGSQAERTGTRADADEAVSQARYAVAEFALDDPERPVSLLGLAAALRRRCERVGQRADLDEAMKILAEAQAVTGQGRLSSSVRSEIASVLAARFKLTQDRADLDEAVSGGRAAVAAAASDDAVMLGNLGLALLTRFQYFGDVTDLDDGIRAERRGVACTSADPHVHASHLSSLSVMLRNRFWRTGKLGDLDEAVDSARQALAVTGDDDYRRADYLTSLAGALHARYWRTGQMACLDEAISGLRTALAATPAGSAKHPNREGNLGQVLHIRAIRTGNAADQGEAITLLQDAVAALPARDSVRTKYLADLGAVFLWLADQETDPANVDKAIASLSEAVGATPPDHPDRCVRVGNLSSAQLLRYEATGSPADLSDAIKTARDALAAASADHPSRAVGLMSLGARLLTRFELAGNAADLEESIAHARDSVAACPPGHPMAADCLRMLGDSLAARFGATGDEQAGQEAFGCWRQALQERAAPASSRIWAAISWGKAAAAQRRFELAEEGFSAAVGLLPLLAWRGLDRRSQERQLAKLPGIASDGAACAVAAGHPERAVELLEHGRAVLWSELLQLRGELDELRRSAPELAGRLDAVRALLDQAGGQQDLNLEARPGALPAAQPGQPREQLADVRMRHADEWDQLLAQVRQLPGFENFLDVPAFGELASAAADGAVVIINVSDYGCDALALTAAGLNVIPLPDLTRESARSQANAFLTAVRQVAEAGENAGGQLTADAGLVIDDVLGWLSDAVTSPVLAALRDDLAQPKASGELPRIWWCPTGPLTILPVHAAGREPGGRELGGRAADRVMDQVVSSYTPTLRALHDARNRPASGPADGPEMLLVTMPVTAYLDGGAPLPGATEEAELVARRFMASMKHFTGSTATRAHVLGALEHARFAHFACHAGVRPDDPSAGGLYLNDGPLTIRQLSELELAAAELAFLSACQSATGSVLHLDESITMAAATQLAGFRDVIGTLWYVADTVAPEVARGVYDKLTGPDASQAAGSGSARALHVAVGKLRAAGYPALLWAPYIHIGP